MSKRKFRYDLWGDTVNTASRMESHGQPGMIHVTADIYRALADSYEFQPRGEIPIKGKSPMETYFLNSPRKPPALDEAGVLGEAVSVNGSDPGPAASRGTGTKGSTVLS